MTRLPSQLQPLWPVAKRIHRRSAWLSGFVGRSTRWMQGSRRLPRRATEYSALTAARDPSRVVAHPGRSGQLIRHETPLGSPRDHWVFARRAHADVPDGFCLEISDGAVVGDYAAVISPDGTLDYETSDYFGISSWREHPIFLRRRLPPVQRVEGRVLTLATRGGNGNFYHFLLDVLPRFGIYESAMGDAPVDAIYAPAAAYQRTFYELAGLGDIPVVPSSPRTTLRASTLLVPSMSNPHEVAPRETVAWLRDRLRPASTGGPRRLYVSRGDKPRTRRLECERDLRPHLEARGFTWVEPGGLSPQEQIDLFAGAEVVVAPHGAALTNLLWVQPGTRVLELFAANYVNAAFWSITRAVGDVEYRYLVAEGAERHGPGSPMNAVQADIDIAPDVVIAAVDELLEA